LREKIRKLPLARSVKSAEKTMLSITRPIRLFTSALVVAAALTTTTVHAQESTRSLDALIDAELGATGGLTADEVGRRASSTSYDVRARRAELLAAAADVDRALSGYLPKLTLTARYTRLSDTGRSGGGSIVAAPGAPEGPIAPGTPLVNVPLDFPVLQNQYTLQASLLVPVSDYFLRVAPADQAAELAEQSAAAKLIAEQNRVVADAKLTYYAWVRARLGVIVAEQALAQSQAHLADVDRALEVGTATRADVSRVESQVASSELLVETSKNLATLSERQLRTALHDREERTYRIGEDLRVARADARDTLDLPSLWRTAVSNRPELVALERGARAQRRQAQVDRAAGWPRLDLFANGYYSNPNQRIFPQQSGFEPSWDAGAQVTWTVSDVAGAGAAGRSTDAKASGLDAQRAALTDRIQIEVTAAAQGLREARVATRTTARRLAAAEESYRARRVLFQNGRATSIELLDAETDLTRARLDAIAARIDVHVARARLEYALGIGASAKRRA
jgi:outer membrane protein TolC